jgi:3-phosphoshikimate 1-carboxyvinyltransferase
MPLPDLIEIVPLTRPVQAEITVPGSKSITNRALILAALAQGETILRGALWSEDTEVMTAALRDLGFQIMVEADPAEACNRTIRMQGLGGRIPRAGTSAKPLELFVGNAGTAARFLAAMVCLGDGVYRLHGVPRMHERPQAALFAALRELGYRVDSPNDKLPAIIHGQTRSAEGGTRNCKVSVAESSQFASALILAAQLGNWQIEVTGANADELPYVEMTRELVKVFPKSGGEFQIEPDASSGSYFWAANWLVSISAWMNDFLEKTPYWQIPGSFQQLWNRVRASYPSTTPESATDDLLTVRVRNWPTSGWQIDSEFPSFIPLPERISREGQLGDSIMTAIILGADLWGGLGLKRREKGIHFDDLQRLRLQECERVVALRIELTKCGAKVVEEGDRLIVFQSKLHGAEIETYNDHRMAMCFAALGLKVPGIKLRNPSCVKKTFPNFFQKLAAEPPHGLGATILNARTGEPLEHHDLFAA